jgi:hypothetical protein
MSAANGSGRIAVMTYRFIAATVALALAGCDCSPSPGRTCTTAGDCGSNETCVDGFCRLMRDGGGGGRDA